MMLIFLLFILFAIWGFMYFVENSKPAPSKYEPLSKEDPGRQVLGDMLSDRISRAEALFFMEKGAQGGLSEAGGCRCLTKDGNTSIEKEGYIPYPLQA